MDDGNYTNATLAFVKWLEANGTTVSDKIDLVDMRNQDAGRGVVAKENIAEDETLFTIPRKTILTTETSSIPQEISSSIADPWLSLIVTMLYEFQQASNSPWSAYFDVLPSDFDTLMFWDEAELKHLQGSAVVDKIGRASADETFQEQILPLVYANVAAFNASSLSNDQLLALCHRMGSTIMAYAFDLESSSAASNSSQDGWEEDSDDEGAGGPVMPKGMVPLADMLNANADLNNAKLFHEEDAVVMRSVKPIAAGEQIYNDYGLLPRADLLRRYGYVTDEYAKYDVVELGEDIITQTAKEHQRLSDDDLANRLAYLDEQAVLDSGYDIARPGSEDGALPEELGVLLNALTTPAADFEKMQKKEKLPKADLTPTSLELLYTILLRRRAEYGPEGTDALRAQLIDGQNNSRRRAMALQVVIGEREILAEVAADVQSKLASGSRKRGADALDFEGEAREVLAKRARN